jgi:hypothetical protein
MLEPRPEINTATFKRLIVSPSDGAVRRPGPTEALDGAA